LIGYC